MTLEMAVAVQIVLLLSSGSVGSVSRSVGRLVGRSDDQSVDTDWPCIERKERNIVQFISWGEGILFLVVKSNSIRGFVRPSVRPSVRGSVTCLSKTANSRKFKKIQQNSTKYTFRNYWPGILEPMTSFCAC